MTRDSEINTVRDLIALMAVTRPDLTFLIGPETRRVSTSKGYGSRPFICLGAARSDRLPGRTTELYGFNLSRSHLFRNPVSGRFSNV